MAAKRRVRGPNRPKLDPAQWRKGLLEEFGMLTQEELATLFGVDVKTLQNKDPKELPPHSRVGGKRFFFKDDVKAYMRRHKVGRLSGA